MKDYEIRDDIEIKAKQARMGIEEKKVSIKILIEEILEKLYETDSRLVHIIGTLDGQNDPEPKIPEDVCCIKDEMLLISEVASRMMRKTRTIEESLL